jgi:hypothetical protein
MQNPLIRDWETSWIAKSIRNLAYYALGKQSLGAWSRNTAMIGELESLLFSFYLCEASLDEYVRTHGDWGDELIRLPAKRLPGGGQG